MPDDRMPGVREELSKMKRRSLFKSAVLLSLLAVFGNSIGIRTRRGFRFIQTLPSGGNWRLASFGDKVMAFNPEHQPMIYDKKTDSFVALSFPAILTI